MELLTRKAHRVGVASLRRQAICHGRQRQFALITYVDYPIQTYNNIIEIAFLARRCWQCANKLNLNDSFFLTKGAIDMAGWHVEFAVDRFSVLMPRWYGRAAQDCTVHGVSSVPALITSSNQISAIFLSSGSESIR